ncbi:MAG: hypothetical protein ACI4G1_04350 [Ruminococcus sp.]
MKKVFGNNIQPDCSYCSNCSSGENGRICLKNKALEYGRCKEFSYDPLRRVPKVQPNIAKMSADDFVL